VTTAAALVLAASAANVLTGDANAADAGGKTAPAEPTKAVLLALETRAYDAWKAKDATFWGSFLSDGFVGWGEAGRLDKASAAKEYTGADCKVASVAVSDGEMTPLGRDAALITHRTDVDATCGGKKLPRASWVASVYVRRDHRWQAAFHAEAAIVDPAALAKPARETAASGEAQSRAADPDAHTAALLLRENAVWDAWKDHDARRIARLIAGDVQFINIFGTHLSTRAEALKNWSGTGCEVKSVRLGDAKATMLSPDAAILTFHARADGTCFGQKIGPVWGSSIYVKDGASWKWNSGINLPARQQGA
jgi:ketosteroid isomerase-like protein